MFFDTKENGVSPGRVDQYLYPYYKEDFEKGRIDYYFNERKCIVPGVKIMPTPGHELLHCAVFARAQDKVWCMAGDGIHYASIISSFEGCI